MKKKNVFIVLAIVLVAGAVVGANFYFKREKPLTVIGPCSICSRACNQHRNAGEQSK